MTEDEKIKAHVEMTKRQATHPSVEPVEGPSTLVDVEHKHPHATHSQPEPSVEPVHEKVVHRKVKDVK